MTAQPKPVAPALDMSPRPVPQDAAFVPRRVDVQATVSSVVACRTCGASNDPNHTYCLSCGSRLPRQEAAPAPAPSPAAVASPAQPAPIAAGSILSVASVAAPAPAPGGLGAVTSPAQGLVISGSPVRVVTPAPVAPETMRFCPRCHGGSDPQAQFCKFCGGSLADVPPVAVPLAATAESAIAVMPTEAVPAPEPVRNTAPPLTTRDAPPAGFPPGGFPPEAETRPVASVASPASLDAPDSVGTKVSAHHASGFLVLVARDGTPAAAYPLLEQMDIGRLEGDVKLVDDPYLSPRHARIMRRDGRYYLRDLGSLNGVYRKLPNGSERDSTGPHVATLRDGELFLIGQQVLKVELVKDASETTGLGAALDAQDGGTHLFGTPSTPRYARLCQRTVEGVTRDVYYVRKPETVLGRESGDFVFPEDPFLSRRHAIIRASVGAATGGFPSVTLADLGSSNGTFVQIDGEISLSHGDCFRVGHQLFRVEIPTSPRPAS
jgi:pSer/pThr/pTyr-binding forkhead associated (FHA) protein